MRYFDLHSDTASVCYKKGIFPDDPSLAVSAQKGAIFEEWIQCFAIFIADGCIDPLSEYRAQINDFKKKVGSFGDVRPLLSLENALFVTGVEYVDELANDGIKSVTLTWNHENLLAGGAYSKTGITSLGRQVIKSLNENNIAIDLSHLNSKSFFQVASEAKTVFASHVCCDRTHHHRRNLTDEQLKLISDRGGVIGVCFYPEFLGTKYAFEGVWRHIFHLLNIGLEDNIAIGSDFDGADMSSELDGIDKIPALAAFLSNKGLTRSLLGKIFFENADKFYEML